MTTPYWEIPSVATNYSVLPLIIAGFVLIGCGLYYAFTHSREQITTVIGGILTAVIGVFLAGIGLTNGAIMADTREQVKVDSLKTWLDSEYGIFVTDESAEDLIAEAKSTISFKEENLTVDYDGTTITVKLVPYGGKDSTWTLVDVTTQQPVAVK